MRGLGLFRGMRRRSGASLIAVPSPLPVIRDDQRDFVAGWGLSGATVNDGAAANYDGTGVADQTRSDVSVGLHGLGKTLSALVLGVTYYADLVVKPDGRNFLLFQVSGAGFNHYGIFDLVANTIGDSLGLAAWTVSDLSNGWKFVRMEFAAGASALHACNLFHATSGVNYSMAGDVTKGLLLDRYVLSRNP